MRRFPSVKNNNDFQRAYRRKKSQANRLLVMYIAENDLDHPRLGVSCSRKTGNSVVRHTLTRKLREIFRLNSTSLKESNQGIDIIIVVRRSCAEASYQEMEEAYLELLKKHKILK